MTKTCKTTLKVGDVLNNKWVILSFIDKGGMGEVYRAHQSNLNRDVAIKVVSQEWLESIDEDDEEVETLVRRFRREVQSMDVKGSPHYMSPEHFFDFKRADQRADVYSLGKMLFEAVEGKITSGKTPFKRAKLAKAESPFFQELDRIIQMATAESRDERTKSVRDLLGQLERVIHGLEFQKKTEKPSGTYFVPSLFSKPKWIWTGIIIAVLSVLSMTIWHLMGEPGLRLQKNATSISTGQHKITSGPGNGTSTETAVTKEVSFAAEHVGKQHLIQGGALTIPNYVDRNSERSVQVDPFYMDEFFVTNQQFVDFLNHNLSEISIESGVVKGNETNWFLLGEVRSGYEPIVYRNKEFHISDPAWASSPVLRITGYGASAFAQYFGRRLPTQEEMLFAMVKGTDRSKLDADPATDANVPQMEDMMGMMQMMGDSQNEIKNLPEQERDSTSPERDQSTKDSVEPMGSDFLLSAASFSPNLLGIKGLNHEIGEWVSKEGQVRPSGDESKTGRYAVIGGVEGAPKDNDSLPSVVERFPWEGFEEIGFRTVENAPGGDSAK